MGDSSNASFPVSGVSNITTTPEGNNMTEYSFCLEARDALQSTLHPSSLGAAMEDQAWVVPTLLFSLSIPLLLAGYKLVRPAVAVGGFLGGVIGSVYIIAEQESMACEAAIGLVASLSVICGILAGFFSRVAHILLGGAAVATFVHLVFESAPILYESVPYPRLFRKPLLYWGFLLVGFLIGGGIGNMRNDRNAIFFSSMIGSAGVVLSIQWIVHVNNTPFPSWLLLPISAVCIVLGLLAQFTLKRRGDKRLREERSSSSSQRRSGRGREGEGA